MKHLTIIGLFFCTLLGSCDTNEAYGGWGMQENYSLTAPNGQKVASNMESLTRKISKAVEKTFRENKDIRITEIIYHDVPAGYMAEIKYETSDGISANAILTNIPQNGKKHFKRIMTRSESPGGSSGEKVYTCSSTDRKKCPNCSVVKKTDGNVECFCSEGQRKYCELTETSV